MNRISLYPPEKFAKPKKEAGSLAFQPACFRSYVKLGGGFKPFFIFIPIWGNDPILDEHIFQRGGKKPPTSKLRGGGISREKIRKLGRLVSSDHDTTDDRTNHRHLPIAEGILPCHGFVQKRDDWPTYVGTSPTGT